MSNSSKDANLKEKLKQALSSTFKVISDDLKINDKLEKDKSSNKFDFIELDNLNTKSDFTIHQCRTCDNTTDFATVDMPYANKLLFQELQTINIVPRIIV